MRISEVIDDTWLRIDPIRVGAVPPGLGTPDRYVTVADGDVPVLRVDVYAFPPDCFAFEEVLVWQGNIVIGFGSHVHVITIANRAPSLVALDSYFGHLHPTAHYLLIASGDRLLRLEPNGSILWTTEVLAIDGVVVNDPGPPLIRGEAEHDPPGGWQPFVVSAADGRTVL